MLLYQFRFNLDWDATPPHSLSSPIPHTHIPSFLFIAHAQYQFPPIVKRTVYIENLLHMLKYSPSPSLLLVKASASPALLFWNTRSSNRLSAYIFLFFLWDVELYTVILNPLNTILTLDWTMHLHNVRRRNYPKFSEIQCIVCAGKLVFLTMHSFSFLFKTLLIPIYFDLIFLNIAWVFWVYFSSLCNCARVVFSWLNLYDKMGLWVGGGYPGAGARRDTGLIAHTRGPCTSSVNLELWNFHQVVICCLFSSFLLTRLSFW